MIETITEIGRIEIERTRGEVEVVATPCERSASGTRLTAQSSLELHFLLVN